jgi:alpha-beta hydrolase superfamily lysophospholipase
LFRLPLREPGRWAPAATMLIALAGCSTPMAVDPSAPAVVIWPSEAAPQPLDCPSGLPEGTRCLGGRDSAGAFYRIAIPARWQGDLVVHAHGGPTLGEPRAERVDEDLQRWSVMLRAGYAWAGSSFRQGGVAVLSAAEDTERLRRLFVAHVGAPRYTVLHGQSWGASVAARAAERYGHATPGQRAPYDAVLLSSGVLGGGTRSYDFRLDLRVVYQALCHNHPRPDEAAYPLWQGLPPGAALTRAQLTQRINECLALDKPAGQRSAEQQRKVEIITRVIRIPEGSIASHLAWATWHFQDIAQHRVDGAGSPFGNVGARYRGSGDDEALNAQVLRYQADSVAVARLSADTDPSGRIDLPVLTVHGIDDPTAFIELDNEFARTMSRAGRADRLVQTFTRDREHSYLSDAAYATLLQSLKAWVQRGEKPTPAGIAAACPALEARFPGCRFEPAYQPAPLDSRVTPRERPTAAKAAGAPRRADAA